MTEKVLIQESTTAQENKEWGLHCPSQASMKHLEGFTTASKKADSQPYIND